MLAHGMRARQRQETSDEHGDGTEGFRRTAYAARIDSSGARVGEGVRDA